MSAILASALDLPGLGLGRRSSLDWHIVAGLCLMVAIPAAIWLWRYRGVRQ